MTRPLVYVESDLPEGMTLTEWRRRPKPVAPRAAWWRRALGLGA